MLPYIASSSILVILVMLGTSFKLMSAEHVYSASSRPEDHHIRIMNFPSADEDDVSTILNSLLKVDDYIIPLEKRRWLVGRFRFTTYIIGEIDEIHQNGSKN